MINRIMASFHSKRNFQKNKFKITLAANSEIEKKDWINAIKQIQTKILIERY